MSIPEYPNWPKGFVNDCTSNTFAYDQLKPRVWWNFPRDACFCRETGDFTGRFVIFNVKISLFYRFDYSEIFKLPAKLLITSVVLFGMVNWI